jgi:hypothetical protein
MFPDHDGLQRQDALCQEHLDTLTEVDARSPNIVHAAAPLL